VFKNYKKLNEIFSDNYTANVILGATPWYDFEYII
jgi:hypothetical protein